jgi:hypothetical protein
MLLFSNGQHKKEVPFLRWRREVTQKYNSSPSSLHPSDCAPRGGSGGGIPSFLARPVRRFPIWRPSACKEAHACGGGCARLVDAALDEEEVALGEQAMRG